MAKNEHSFGGPKANRSGNPSTAVAQREFYRWVETQATEDELQAYVRDKTKPLLRRRFIQVFMAAESVKDFCEVTNQTHGKPREDINITSGDLIIKVVED